MNHAIPTDAAVQKKGVQITSKCLCCALNPLIETANHLFLQSETTTVIWSKLALLLGMNCNTTTISQFFSSWWIVANVKNLKQWLVLITLAVGLWQLWKGRNCAKYEDHVMEGNKLLLSIQRYVNQLFAAHMHSFDSEGVSKDCMLFFNLPYHVKPRLHCLISWLPPKMNWLKLNCDGAAKGNPGIAGGGYD